MAHSSGKLPDFPHLFRAVVRRVRQHVICFGSLRSTEPVNLGFGIRQGKPIDRYYMEDYLRSHSNFVRGRVLEIGDNAYTNAFGGERVTLSEILNFDETVPGAHYIGRIENCPEIPDNTFDSIILTQTLHYVFNMPDAIKEIYRILKPGGTILCTVPGISQISRCDMDQWGDRWRLTSLSAQELFETAFEREQVKVQTYGNVLSAVALLEGIPTHKLRKRELDVRDDDYHVLVCVTATKSEQ